MTARKRRPAFTRWYTVATWIETQDDRFGNRAQSEMSSPREPASSLKAARSQARAWLRDPRLIPGHIARTTVTGLEVLVVTNTSGRERSEIVSLDSDLFTNNKQQPRGGDQPCPKDHLANIRDALS